MGAPDDKAMPAYGYTVRQYHRNHKAAFICDHLAEAQAAADLLGPDVKTLVFDGATIASDPSVTVQFRSKVGDHAVWIKVTPDGDRLIAEKVLDQRE